MTDAQPAVAAAAARSPRQLVMERLRVIPPLAAVIAMEAILIAWFALSSPFFLTTDNWLNILLAMSVLGLLALPNTLLLVGGQLDLSITANAAFCGMLFSLWFGDIATGLAVFLAFVIGGSIGVLNGVLVAKIRINWIIATLGTLAVFRGLTRLVSDGATIRVEGFEALGRTELFGEIPVPIVIFLGLALLAAILYRFTVYGRSIQAVGSNSEAARLQGVSVARVLFIAFVMAGFCAALAGLVNVSQLGAGSSNAFLGAELDVITAVIIGGTSFSGGRGTIVGTVLGLCILATLNNGLVLIGVSPFWQEVSRGIALIVAVTLDRLRVQLQAAAESR
jgi:ribose transport system permease protein